MIRTRRREAMGTTDLRQVLDEAGADYELLPHAHTETAASEAEALGIALDDVGKTLVVSSPGGYVRVVLPASRRLDLHKLRELVEGGKRVHLATEEDLVRDYPEFDLGAVPPVGGSRRDRVIVDPSVAEREAVVLEAGSHEESLRIRTGELLRVAGAEVADICQD
jgi:Ala-tRNA(Pro) deacylase